jgi:hypothetical protein
MTEPMKIDDLIAKYIKVRDAKSQLKAKYEAEAARYTELQDKIEAVLLAKFAELGVESVRSQGGTAYVSTRTSASMADWDTFRAFCESQDDPFVFLDRRVSKAAVEQYRAANDDLPPGVNWTETRVVNFRKS